MEPLVEVNNAKELEVAKSVGAKVIGINNRRLDTFEVDLSTTTSLLNDIPQGVIVCALSGISGPDDVQKYKESGVDAVLVGEALMKTPDLGVFVSNLLGNPELPNDTFTGPNTLVKICGVRTTEAASAAIEAGADMISMILVQGRKRCVSEANGLAISKLMHSSSKKVAKAANPSKEDSNRALAYFRHTSMTLKSRTRPLLCGVFQNQPLSHVLAQQNLFDLDVVQLHGDEPDEWASLIPVPVIRRFEPSSSAIGRRGYHALPLLDSAVGGTGQMLDFSAVKTVLAADRGLRVMIAGGLDSTNVASVLEQLGDCAGQVVGVDVSSGVEEGGAQSLEKIKAFVDAVRKI